MVEVYKAADEGGDKPVTSVSSDVQFSAMDFVSRNEIVVADTQGKLTLVKGIESEDTTRISLMNTKMGRFRDVRCYPQDSNTLVAVSTEGKLAFYDVQEMRKFDLEISNIKPIKSVKSKSRLLCLTINHLKP